MLHIHIKKRIRVGLEEQFIEARDHYRDQILDAITEIEHNNVGSVSWSGESWTLRRIAHAAFVVIW